LVAYGLIWCAENGKLTERLALDAGPTKRLDCAFAQILGKLYFFNLRENLQRILFDYGQKRLGTANVAFKAAC